MILMVMEDPLFLDIPHECYFDIVTKGQKIENDFLDEMCQLK